MTELFDQDAPLTLEEARELRGYHEAETYGFSFPPQAQDRYDALQARADEQGWEQVTDDYDWDQTLGLIPLPVAILIAATSLWLCYHVARFLS